LIILALFLKVLDLGISIICLEVVDKLVKMTCMQGCFRSSKMRKCYNLQAHVSYKIAWTQSKKGICFVNKMFFFFFFFFNGAIDYKYGPMVILLKMGSTTSDMGRWSFY
jgi:hypothetical protein